MWDQHGYVSGSRRIILFAQLPYLTTLRIIWRLQLPCLRLIEFFHNFLLRKVASVQNEMNKKNQTEMKNQCKSIIRIVNSSAIPINGPAIIVHKMTKPRAGWQRNCSSIRGRNKRCLVKTARLDIGAVRSIIFRGNLGSSLEAKHSGGEVGGEGGLKLATHSYLVSSLRTDGATHTAPGVLS